MGRFKEPFRVYIGLVPTGYLNLKAIEQTIREGMHYCGFEKVLNSAATSTPKILVRPDVIAAHPKVARYAYTHPDVIRALITQTLRISPKAKFFVCERGGYGLPTHRMLARANGNSEQFRGRGYYELEHLFPGHVTVEAEEETRQYRYRLSKGGVMSKADLALKDEERLALLRASNESISSHHFYDAHLAVYCPKLKSSVFTQGFSGALALGGLHENPGIRLDQYLCDQLEVCHPKLVIGDSIVAAVGGSQISQRGHELGAMLIANNALAHDWVAAQILGLDPLAIKHLKFASLRGWGPSHVTQIELGGAGHDGIAQLVPKTRFWDLGNIAPERLHEKFERENPGLKFPLEILSGSDEPGHSNPSQNMFLEWLYRSYDFPQRRAWMARWPRVSVVTSETSSFPSHKTVVVLGNGAIESILRRTSLIFRRIGWKRLGLQILHVQLKNGKLHRLVCVKGQPPTPAALTVAFFAGSYGAILPSPVDLRFALDRILGFARDQWHRAARRTGELRLVLTSRMPQNSWWSLMAPAESSRTDYPRALPKEPRL